MLGGGDLITWFLARRNGRGRENSCPLFLLSPSPFLGTYLLAWSEEGKKGLNNGRFVGREGGGGCCVYAKVGGNEKRGCIPGKNHVAVPTIHEKKRRKGKKGK